MARTIQQILREALPAEPDFLAATYRHLPVVSSIAPAQERLQKNKGDSERPDWKIEPINDPQTGEYCAKISYKLIAESPLLCGQRDDEGKPIPARLVGNGSWCIPGSSLRGLIKNICEITSFSRLTQFNRKRVFGLRNFQHASYKRGDYPVMNSQSVGAGWIRVVSGHNHLKLEDGRLDADKLKNVEIQINPRGLNGWHEEKIQVGGKTKTRFSVESASNDPSDWVTLPAAIIVEFFQINCAYVENELKPYGGLAEKLGDLRSGKKLRVFYVGDPRNALTLPEAKAVGISPFAMGFPRMFRVPHLFNLEDVVEATLGRDPFDISTKRNSIPPLIFDDQLNRVRRVAPFDMTEALFGFVNDATLVSGLPENKKNDVAGLALKSRVSFSHARIVDADSAEERQFQFVASNPSASYAPYYLLGSKRTSGVGPWRDYSPPDGVAPEISGRKTYLPRFNDKRPQEAAAEFQRNCEHSIGLANGNEDIQTNATFLTARAGKELAFTGEIRLHNVTAVEIGMILHALTFDGKTQDHRHMIGNAKPLGAGQIKVEGVSLNAERNDGAKDGLHQAGFIDEYKKYMMQPDVIGQTWQIMQNLWLSSADPKNGATQAAAGRLQSMELEEYGEYRSLVQPDADQPAHAPKGGIRPSSPFRIPNGLK